MVRKKLSEKLEEIISYFYQMKPDLLTIPIKSIAEHHKLADLRKPQHPLFSIYRFEEMKITPNNQRLKIISDLYQITLKDDCPCKTKYGQNQYDFDEGLMNFFAPKQTHVIEPGDWMPEKGFLLLVHPDFFQGNILQKKIKEYGFFDYATDEALILSEGEEQSIKQIFRQIEKEYLLPIDQYSQDVVLSNIDLLLTYCNRYYNRQFITRKTTNNQLQEKVSQILDEYIQQEAPHKGLPTAQFLANELNLSAKYLSDCLKNLTGLTTQQIIHEKLIEKAKDILTTTELSVSEIAYQLGFEFPQSLNRLFKNKTKQTPLEFRASFN